MIELTDQLTVLTPQHRVRSKGGSTIIIRTNKKGASHVVILPTAWHALGSPAMVTIALSRKTIAIEASNLTSPNARVVNKSGRTVMAHDIADLFSIKPGERFVMDAVMNHGRLVAELPSAFYTRYQYKVRRANEVQK